MTTVAPPEIALDLAGLDRLLPMHLLIGADGAILHAGPTMRRMLPDGAGTIRGMLVLLRDGTSHSDPARICRACHEDERLFLRLTGRPHLTLRGHAIPVAAGFLLNLGFGIGLVDAVGELDLDDGDFSPSELAMEFLFLHEANRAVMTELSRFNRHLDDAREMAEQQAFTDPLTGLHNRRALAMAIEALLRPGRQRRAGTGFAVMHLDLDHFKRVNDDHGHAAGDAILQDVAQILRETVRSHDTAARVGGDEFILLLDRIESPQMLGPLARRIISRIETPVTVGDALCHISASAGVVWARHDDRLSAEWLLAEADAALYRAKREGRGRAMIVCADTARKDAQR